MQNCIGQQVTDFQFYQLIITFIFSIVAAGFTYVQWQVNKSKLRLDLYNRRFDVYLKTLDYYLAYMHRKPDDSYEYLDKCAIAFIKVYRESLFLFGEESEVYKLLTDFQQNIGQRVSIDKKLSSSQDIDDRSGLFKAKNPLSDSIITGEELLKLEKSLKVWLNFHEIN